MLLCEGKLRVLGGYRFKSTDLSNDLEFACGVGPPDATGRPTVRVERRGSAVLKQTLADRGAEITIHLFLPSVGSDGEYETALERKIDFGVVTNVTVEQYGEEDMRFSSSSRGLCSVVIEDGNVFVRSSIKVHEIVSTGRAR